MHARRPHPYVAREADPRAGDLSRARLAAELAHDLGDHPETGGAERVALGEEPAVGVDRQPPAELGDTVGDQAAALAGLAEAERLVLEDLRDRKTVMELDHVEVAGPEPSAFVGLARGSPDHLEVELVEGLLADVRGE